MEKAYNDLDFAIGNEAASNNQVKMAYNQDAININMDLIKKDDQA